jgi:AbrB family transcriptional regulator (stage V sporulation protein T)
MVKRIDDVGRVAIPKDLRRSLHWLGGDEIEIIDNKDGSLTLRKYEPEFAAKLSSFRADAELWAQDNGVPFGADFEEAFDKIIQDIIRRENLQK